ncbi:MAG: phosphopyruvate hydratase [Pirellulaceae bacterium]|nr:phosphopyruvate hydratase [Pirellulaceae bacterium]
MASIQRIHAREVLDSRGRPTVEVEVHAGAGVVGRAIVPSGASTGSAEARELRDGDASRYDGLGVRQAVEHVRGILQAALLGWDCRQQRQVDERLLELDPSPGKRQLGANALLGVSLAVAHAGAAAAGVPLYEHLAAVLAAAWDNDPCPAPPGMPLPMTNMISGGLHAGGNLDFQDVLIMPRGAPDYPTALEWIVRVYRRLGSLLTGAGYEGWLVGDEGGYGPRLRTNREAVEFVIRAIEAAGLRPGDDVTLALDVAASHFYQPAADAAAGPPSELPGSYVLRSEGGVRLSSDQMIDRLEAWVDAFPIASIEDGLAEDDWTGWRHLRARLGDRVLLVGDDLLATNPRRLQRAIAERAANSALIKVNQIGTLSETLETMRLARLAGWSLVVSARSGETEDTTIADLAVASAAELIKIGSIVRGERLAKYNQLLRIDERLR